MNVMPASIEIYDTERELGYVHEGLDYDYIDGAAQDIARYLWPGGFSCEVNYQPGDGTRYGLVITPLWNLACARPRVKDGKEWDRHSIDGMSDGDEYDPHGYLVSWAEHRCYPIRLGGGRGVLAASYIAEHWDTTPMSGCSLAILLRAIRHHLDR